MRIQFQCGSCQQALSVEPAHAGREVRCPKCGSVEVAPAQTSKAQSPVDPLFPVAEQSTAAETASPTPWDDNPYSSPTAPTYPATHGYKQSDTSGLMGVIFGALAILFSVVMGLCCGPFVLLGGLFAVIGLIMSLYGQPPMKHIGLALNGVALGIIVLYIGVGLLYFFLAVATA